MVIYHFLGLLCCFSAGKKILSDIIVSSVILKKVCQKKNELVKKRILDSVYRYFHSINYKCVLFVVCLSRTDKKLEARYDTIMWQTFQCLKVFVLYTQIVNNNINKTSSMQTLLHFLTKDFFFFYESIFPQSPTFL